MSLTVAPEWEDVWHLFMRMFRMMESPRTSTRGPAPAGSLTGSAAPAANIGASAAAAKGGEIAAVSVAADDGGEAPSLAGCFLAGLRRDAVFSFTAALRSCRRLVEHEPRDDRREPGALVCAEPVSGAMLVGSGPTAQLDIIPSSGGCADRTSKRFDKTRADVFLVRHVTSDQSGERLGVELDEGRGEVAGSHGTVS